MKKGGLQPEGYIPRLIDRELSRRLDNIGAVEVASTAAPWVIMAIGLAGFAAMVTSESDSKDEENLPK